VSSFIIYLFFVVVSRSKRSSNLLLRSLKSWFLSLGLHVVGVKVDLFVDLFSNFTSCFISCILVSFSIYSPSFNKPMI
jgi:hypothetical protein